MIRKFSYYNGLGPTNVTWAVHNVQLRMELNHVRIIWENPNTPLFSFVRIVKRTLGFSEGLNDPKNILIFEGVAETFLDEGEMDELETYYYTVYGINGSLTGEERMSRWLWTNAQNLDAISGNFEFITIRNEPLPSQLNATVEVLANSMRLIVTGGINAHDTTLNFADADKDTIAELLTAISALNKGWVTSRIGETGLPSENLKIVGPIYTMGGDVILYGEYPAYAPINPDLEKITNNIMVVTIGTPPASITWAWDYDSQASIVVGHDYEYTKIIYGE